MRFLFHLLYHPFAWTYDWVAALVSVGMWKDWVFSILPEIAGPAVLELGSGPGHLQQKLLRDPDIRPIALERSPQMVQRSTRMLEKAGLKHRMVRGDALRLPFARGVLNTVIATFPAEYIADPQAWREAGRVLKKGGRFVVLLGAGITGSGLLHRAADLLFRITGQTGAFDEDAFQTRLNRVIEEPIFQTRILHKPVKSSQVIIIVAERN